MTTPRSPPDADASPALATTTIVGVLPVVELNDGQIVSEVNAAFSRLLGKSSSELVGRTFAEIMPGSAECLPILDDAFRTTTLATRSHTADDPRWLHATYQAVDGVQPPQVFAIQLTSSALHRDVSAMNEALLVASLRQHEQTEVAERLNAELQAALEQLATADQKKDNFLAVLAHELRNPLAPIKNAARLLHMVNTDDPIVVRARAIVERQADHLAKLVDDLLDVSRIQQGKVRLRRAPLDLVSAAVRSLDACVYLTRAHDLKVALDVQPDQAIYVDADETRIDQILVNLITNAAKYTPSQGSIKVKVALEEGTAVVRVSDNGIGIAPEMLERVFDIFTQVEESLERSHGGLGLGLKLVRELVEMHGGTVEAKSDGLNHGSEFIVRLPVVPAPAPRPAAAAQASGAVRPRRILLVDDNLDLRESMAMYLSIYGHTIELAVDGEQAVQKALQGQAEVAFIDIGLPKLNGYDVARAIRAGARGATIILIALSGYGQGEDKRQALEAGFDAHFTKPLDPDEMTLILDDLDNFRRRMRTGDVAQ